MTKHKSNTFLDFWTFSTSYSGGPFVFSVYGKHKSNTCKITDASLLCNPHFELVMLEGLLCFQHFQLVLLEELLCFPYIENTKAPSNQQKSQKVLLLCFVTFVTFVFYAHPCMYLDN